MRRMGRKLDPAFAQGIIAALELGRGSMKAISTLLFLLVALSGAALGQGRWGQESVGRNTIIDFSGLVNRPQDLPDGVEFLKIPDNSQGQPGIRQITSSELYAADVGGAYCTGNGSQIVFHTKDLRTEPMAVFAKYIICIMNLADLQPRILVRDGKDGAISPDGRYLAYVSLPERYRPELNLPADLGTNALSIVRLSDMREVFRCVSGYDPSWSRDGRFVLCSRFADSQIGYVTLQDTSGGQPGFAWKPLSDSAGFETRFSGRHPALSPDQNVLAYTRARDNKILLYYLNQGRGERLTQFTGWEGSPTFSPDGQWIAWWHIVDLNHDGIYLGTEPVELYVTHLPTRKHYSLGAINVMSPHWSPDGRYIYGTFNCGMGQHWSPDGHEIYGTFNTFSLRIDEGMVARIGGIGHVLVQIAVPPMLQPQKLSPQTPETKATPMPTHSPPVIVIPR